ncbi:MAG TPA: IS110 family transposase [bacterium]|nr:IS110 family transposase [bacterium]
MRAATRSAEYTTHSTAPALYLAFELGVEEWKLGFTAGVPTKIRVRVIPARDVKRLAEEIATAKRRFTLADNTLVRSCYEAGPEGFWLHRHLETVGIDNRVVDSSSIEVKRRRRRAKSDGLDVRSLLGMLMRYHAGEAKVWSVVKVPTVEEEDRRQLHRELRTLKQERTRVMNRIRGLLATQGLRLPQRRDLSAVLDTMQLWDGSPLPARLRARLQREWEHAKFLHTKILELQRQRYAAIKHERSEVMDKVRALLHLRGIGENSAWVYVHEFFGWREFDNRKQVGAAAGLAPTPYQSGNDSREQGISKAGSRHIRAVAIETAWCWLRYQPKSQLSRWFDARFGHGGPRARKIGIVALARKLLIEVWRFLKNGTVPEGALLKG